ncbi:hypothetical protein [Paraburkholderia sp. HP33-1]|uniref:hypothetical protein n=1 Tax=Paraburkholderia sp. HP33-1 TaxID=2883243 RepID=UPI002DD42189|nr:hypothetical protein [Paraburkholderia sp. HP33-1]
MEQQKQGGTGGKEECLLCRVTYSIFSNFPPMPSAKVLNVETGEFFPLDRLRSYSTGYKMAEALGYAWACDCRGRTQQTDGASMASALYGSSPRVSQNLGNAQPFVYQPDMLHGDAMQLAGADGRPGNNQAQNRQFKAVVKALGLNKDQARRLHYDIQKDDLEYHGMMERALELFGDKLE